MAPSTQELEPPTIPGRFRQLLRRSKHNPCLLLVGIAKVLRHLRHIELGVVAIRVVVNDVTGHRFPTGKSRQKCADKPLLKKVGIANDYRCVSFKVSWHTIVDVFAKTEEVVVVEDQGKDDVVVVERLSMPVQL